jgi:RNA polymerase-binding protein DksA
MAQKAAVNKAKKTSPKKPEPAVKKVSTKPSAAKAPSAKAATSTPKSKVTKITIPANQGAGKKSAAEKAKEALAAIKPVKPGKVSSGLGKADLNYFRNLLLEKRSEILGDVNSMESEAFKTGSNLSNMPIHMADVGTDNFEQEFTLGLIESERQILREIQSALVRIEDGTFGICEGTGKPIGRVRLEAVPWAKYCMEYKTALESGAIRQDSGGSSDEEEADDDED